jgi:hypothetical protein
MTVTVAVEDNAYMLVVKKQTELLEKTGKKLRISDVVARAIIKGIDMVEI